MSIIGDAIAALRQVVLLDDRVTKLQGDVDAMRTDVNGMNLRLSRLEGMFEMAMYHEQRRIERD